MPLYSLLRPSLLRCTAATAAAAALPSITRKALLNVSSSSRVSSMTPTITVDKQRSLVDEQVAIHLSGLPSNASVTVKLRIREPYASFSSCGHYRSDSSGRLDLSSCESTGGTYTGKDAMGLFWSLQQDLSQKIGLRLLRREAENPLLYQLTAYSGHVTWEQLSQSDGSAASDSKEAAGLCSVGLERTYLADSVERIPVRFGRIRGSLFKPRSQTACPPVIDLFGTGGGLMEHRAALLAKEGFSVLSLAFFNYQDLPKSLLEIDMDYFEEAIDYMLASPYSKTPSGTDGLAMIGTSTGADIAAYCGILFGRKIRSVIWLNGTLCGSWYPVRYRGRLLQNFKPIDASLITTSPRPPGLSFREALRLACSPDRELRVEQASCSFLFVSCLDDYSADPESGGRLAERLRLSGRKDFSHVTYQDAGHLIEPPISPCTSLGYHRVFGILMDYGGKPLEHHQAQTDAWARMIHWVKTAFSEKSARL